MRDFVRENENGRFLFVLNYLAEGAEIEMKMPALDLWTGETVKAFNGTLEIQSLEPHACRMFRVKIIDK